MKIALFTDTFYPKTDGVVTSTISLARALTKAGHEVLIVAPRPANFLFTNFSISQVKILWLRSFPTGFYPDLRLAIWTPKFHHQLAKFKIDLAHVMTPMSIGLMGITYARLHKLPLVMTFHTYYMDPQYLRIIKIKKAAQRLSQWGWQSARLFYSKADCIIAPSKFVAKDLKHWQFKEPIITIPNGIELTTSALNSANILSLKKKYKIENKKVLLTVGRVSAEKNFDGLLRIFHQVYQAESSSHLLIIGKGPALLEIKHLAKKMHLDEAVTFLGEIPHQKLINKGYYHLGQLFITASMSETQGLTALEAQLHQLPVIAYNSRGLAEMIGQAGCLIKENDETSMAKMAISLLSDPKKIQKLQQFIPTNLANFEVGKTTDKIIKIYEKILKNKPNN